LVDECQLFVAPIVVGGGKRSLPNDVRVRLELLDERRFEGGMVYLHYRTKAWGGGDDARLSLRGWIDDTTIEALASRPEDNPRGLYLVQDELTGWIKGSD
jgi:hypothetical protein